MQLGLEPQPGIVIQVIAWSGIFPRIFTSRNPISRGMRVFIDGKCVGALTDKHARTFPVSVGPHQVMVKHGVLRSETLDVCVTPGERAELECDYHRDYIWLIYLWAFLGPSVLERLSVWPAAAVWWIGMLASGLYLLKTFITPGFSLYLRPRAVWLMPGAEAAPPSSATA
jgi:hypothetical protein